MAAKRRKSSSRKSTKKRFIKSGIKRPGALTSAVGGKPSKKLAQVRRLAKTGSPTQRRQANFYLNVLRPAAKRRKKR